MSCSKPLPPFTFDLLYYLNRDQLERFSIVCRPLKNFIDRYFHSKPYRIFDRLYIRGGMYALEQYAPGRLCFSVYWHPNRGDYTAQQFLAGKRCSIDKSCKGYPSTDKYYPFAEMRPYLRPTVRIKSTTISVAGSITYNAEHVDEMQSITYLWCAGKIHIRNANSRDSNIRIGAEDFQLVLNSPTILQCQTLSIDDARFSFKDYKVLYAVKVLEIHHHAEDEIDLWHQYWQEFLEEPGVKPIVDFFYVKRQIFDKLLDRLFKAFSSAISPNSFKIVIVQYEDHYARWDENNSLTEFREKNSTSGEILELKKGLPAEYENRFDNMSYTLERYSI